MRSRFSLRVRIVVLVGCFAFQAQAKNSGQTFPDSSLYTLNSTWITDDGAKIHIGDLQGRVRLFTLFFSHCESSCPMVLTRLKFLEAKLPKDWNREAGFVMVTLDPRRDDSGGLAEYRRSASLPADRWTLLRGNPEDTRELAMLLGVAYLPSNKNGGFEHNVAMVLVDRKGKVLRRDTDLKDADGQLQALHSAIADSSGDR